MQARYYMLMEGNPNDRREFEDVESMQNFLVNNPSKGELFHTIGIKIKYNPETGVVRLKSIKSPPGITNIFSNKAFEAQLKPVKDAICRIAKQYLLFKLYSLNDPGINQIIEENQLKFDRTTGKMMAGMHAAAIDNTLFQIQRYIRPGIINRLFFSRDEKNKTQEQTQTKQAVYLAFEQLGIYQHGIDHIKSINDVDKIMGMVEIKQLPKARL